MFVKESPSADAPIPAPSVAISESKSAFGSSSAAATSSRPSTCVRTPRAMMTPIALGVLTHVLGRDEVAAADDDPNADFDSEMATDGAGMGASAEGDSFTNIQISMLLGTAYAASV